MKHIYKIMLIMLLALTSLTASAEDFEVDGIYYHILSKEDLTCEVTNSNNKCFGDIIIPSSVTYEEKTFSVTKIGAYAFQSCLSLTSVTIGDHVTEIGEFAFNFCHELTSVTIPNSVTWIGTYAFHECYKLESVTIGNSVTTIREYAFYGCKRLASVYISDIATWCNISFRNEYSNPLYYAHNLYLNDVPLTDLVIPNSVTKIEKYAFYGYSNLNSVTIGTGVISVDSYAFKDCSSLYKLILLPNTVPSGLSNALDKKSERVTYVANDNYSGSVYGTIKKYDYLSSYFDVDGIRYVPISPSERTCAAITSTYSKDINAIKMNNTVTYNGIEMKVIETGKHLLRNNPYVESIEVSSPIDIPDYFACDCSNLKSILLKDEVKSIGNYAFQKCTQLNSAIIKDDVESIGDYAFQKCTQLNSVVLTDKISSIGNDAFYSCDSLASIILPYSLKTIKTYAFSRTGLTSIEIPSSTTEIEDGVFNGCSNLTKFTAKDGKEVLNLGYNSSYKGLFYDCPLKEVELGRSISYNTSNSPFYRNASLETVKLTDTPTEVFTNEFYGCTALKNVTIGDGVEKIGDYAFSGCSALETFTFGASMKTIGKEAFSDCTAMIELYAEPSTPPTCDTQALDDINKWNCKLFVPESAQANYSAADQWKEFFYIEPYNYSGEGGSGDETQDEPSTCAAPTIEFVDGKIIATSATKGATCYTSITTEDYKSHNGNEPIVLTGVYNVSSYAYATGYQNSETVTKQFNIMGDVVANTVEVHDTVYVEKVVEIEVPVIEYVEVHDTIYIEVPVEVHDTIYIYDDSHADINLTDGTVCTLRVVNGIIYIENAPLYEDIIITSIDGKVESIVKVEDNTTEIELPRNNIYVITIEETQFKIKI